MIVPRRVGLALVAVVCAASAFVLAALALDTPRGARVDEAIFAHVSGSSIAPVRAVGQRALDGISAGSIAIVVAVAAALALGTRRARAAVEAVVIVGAAIATTELLKRALPRVGLERARGEWRGTFPSGHATVAASVALALVAAVPPRLKPLTALAGAVYAAGIGSALLLLGWHLPSDVLGAYLVAGFWTAVVLLPSSAVRVRSPLSVRSVALAAVAVAAAGAAVAYVAAHHPALTAAAALSSRALIASFVLFAAVSITIFAAVASLVGEGPA